MLLKASRLSLIKKKRHVDLSSDTLVRLPTPQAVQHCSSLTRVKPQLSYAVRNTLCFHRKWSPGTCRLFVILIRYYIPRGRALLND